MATSFDALWAELAPVGRHRDSGGYRRYAYSGADMECREWFTSTAAVRGLDVETDRNGNLWAWWNPSGVSSHAQALVIGSHLDSVPDGGAFDGPLGVVSSFAAIDAVQGSGFVPSRPVAVVAFADEEGARFGIACGGSRLMTGQLDAAKARSLVGRDGATMAEAMARVGHDATGLGRDDERLARIGTFIELHVEQGRSLIDSGAPVGVASAIWPHGRYLFTFRGMADHAGTTRMIDRHDPMVTFARTAIVANDYASTMEARATFGRIEVEPNGTNAIPSTVRAWLDARAMDQRTLDELVRSITNSAEGDALTNGTSIKVDTESITEVLDFDVPLRDRLATLINNDPKRSMAPILPTGAGHDAGILAAAGLPTAMVFVRNPTGVSHSPNEFAESDDCHAGVDALARILAELSR